MTKWVLAKELKAASFRRLSGVKRTTFERMLEILRVAEIKKKRQGGRPHKLILEDRLLMALEYLREYRTYFHIGQSYGISESNAYQAIRWIEDQLIRSKAFSLPGRKALLKSENEFEIILIDATESPIERPKKTKSVLLGQKEAAHHKNTGGR